MATDIVWNKWLSNSSFHTVNISSIDSLSICPCLNYDHIIHFVQHLSNYFCRWILEKRLSTQSFQEISYFYIM